MKNNTRPAINSNEDYFINKFPLLPSYCFPLGYFNNNTHNQNNPQINKFYINETYLQYQQSVSCCGFNNQSFIPVNFNSMPNMLISQESFEGYSVLKDSLFHEDNWDLKSNKNFNKFFTENYPAFLPQFQKGFTMENDTLSELSLMNPRKEKTTENLQYKPNKAEMECLSSIKNENDSSMNQDKEEVIQYYECVFSTCVETFANKSTWQKHYELHLKSL